MDVQHSQLFKNIVSIRCVCSLMSTCIHAVVCVEIREQLLGVSFLLLLFEVWGLKSVHQAWCYMLLPTESSDQPSTLTTLVC